MSMESNQIRIGFSKEEKLYLRQMMDTQADKMKTSIQRNKVLMVAVMLRDLKVMSKVIFTIQI